jgi:Uma2 family endonuclease
VTATTETAAAPLLTYEAYLAEGEVNRRYDILDGVRVFMTNPTRRHQRILIRIAELLLAYERRSGRGEALTAPTDVLIRRAPLRTRQPDVLFISHAQLAKCAADTDPAPLEAAPELVVEILSPSETPRARDARIRDYQSVGVQECWVVSPAAGSVTVLRLTPAGAETAATYGSGDTIASLTFPDLTLPVAEIFAL